MRGFRLRVGDDINDPLGWGRGVDGGGDGVRAGATGVVGKVRVLATAGVVGCGAGAVDVERVGARFVETGALSGDAVVNGGETRAKDDIPAMIWSKDCLDSSPISVLKICPPKRERSSGMSSS